MKTNKFLILFCLLALMGLKAESKQDSPIFVGLECTEYSSYEGDYSEQLNLSLLVGDALDVTVSAVFRVAGVAHDLEFTFEKEIEYNDHALLTRNALPNQELLSKNIKYVKLFKASIPEEYFGSYGKIDITLTNSAGNQTKKENIPFLFVYQGYTGFLPQDSYPVGLLSYDGNSPIRIAVDFHTDIDTWIRIHSVSTVANADLDIDWKVVKFNTAPTDEQIGMFEGEIYTEYVGEGQFERFVDNLEVGDFIKDHDFAVVFDIPAAANENQTNGQGYGTSDGSHSWIEYSEDGNTSWKKLEQFGYGDWLVKIEYTPGTGGVEEELLPGRAKLYQNYPNPFNPETTIKFYNNMSGLGKLTVYNVKGEVVAKLIDGRVKTGYHSVKFDAFGLNSGIYYYRLEVPSRTITKKMILIK